MWARKQILCKYPDFFSVPPTMLSCYLSLTNVYLQDGCWHSLWHRAVDYSKAPFHGSMKLLLAPLLCQEDPRGPAEAAANLSSVWLKASIGVNEFERQRQVQARTQSLTRTGSSGKVLTRHGSFLLQRTLLKRKHLAEILQTRSRLESRRKKKANGGVCRTPAFLVQKYWNSQDSFIFGLDW